MINEKNIMCEDKIRHRNKLIYNIEIKLLAIYQDLFPINL